MLYRLTRNRLLILIAVVAATWLAVAILAQDSKTTRLVGLLLIGSIAFAWAIRRTARPGFLIAIVTPFEGIISLYFGIAGNWLTVTPLASILVPTRKLLWDIFLGTWIQKLLALMVVAMIPSYVQALVNGDLLAFYSLAQKFALFFIVGIVAYSFSKGQMNRWSLIYVLFATLLAIISMLEFYSGANLFTNSEPVWGDAGLVRSIDSDPILRDHINRGILNTSMRLRGVADSLSVNRFTFYLILPLFLSTSIFATSSRKTRMILGGLVFTVLAIAFLGTLPRSGAIGIVIGVVIMLPSLKIRVRHLVAVGIASIVIGLVLANTVFGDLLKIMVNNDFFLSAGSRQEFWAQSIELYARSNWLFGAGYGITDRLIVGDDGAVGTHNGYLRLLTEQGAVAALAFVLVFWFTIKTLATGFHDETRVDVIWRSAFLAAFLAMTPMILTHDYLFERIVWLPMAAAIYFRRRRSLSRQSAAVEMGSSPPNILFYLSNISGYRDRARLLAEVARKVKSLTLLVGRNDRPTPGGAPSNFQVVTAPRVPGLAPLNALLAALAVRKFVKSRRIDIVHDSSSTLWIYTLFRASSKRPVIVTSLFAFQRWRYQNIWNQFSLRAQIRHRPLMRVLYAIFAEHIMTRKADRVVIQAPGLMVKLPAGTDPRKVKVLTNALDTEFWKPRSADAVQRGAHISLLFAGGVGPTRGVWDIFNAMKIADDRGLDTRLILAGRWEPGSGPEGRTLINRLGISDRVTTPSVFNRDQMLDAYHTNDMLIYPTLNEGSPRVVLEAMASGIPVVATRHPGIEVLDPDARYITFVDGNSPEGLARAIADYSERPEVYITRAKKASEWIESRFSLAAVAESYAEFYDTL